MNTTIKIDAQTLVPTTEQLALPDCGPQFRRTRHDGADQFVQAMGTLAQS